MPENFKKTLNLKNTGQPREISRTYSADKINMQRIDRPKQRQTNELLFKKGIWILLAIILIFVYFFWLRPAKNGDNLGNKDWYAVKLVNEEIFYGQIGNTASDPIVIANVYYNYDQGDLGSGTGNLRLVKRGKETHGPNGTINIVRSQVLYMEPLKESSKVLEAILVYEQ